MTDLLLTTVIVAFVIGLVSATLTVRRLVRTMRAEAEVVRQLQNDAEFIRTLLDYLEALDRDGVPTDPAVATFLRQQIQAHAAALGGGRAFVLDGLNQPSAVGRERYLEKLAERVARERELASSLRAS